MRIDVITLFPKTVDLALSESIIARARKESIIDLNFVDIRSFTKDKHRTVDDRPYGGGAGMVMMAEPLYKAVKSVARPKSYVVLMSPRGRVFTQKTAKELSLKKHIVFVCGHYEGIDERFVETVDDSISIGDYVLTGGELAAAVVIDSVTRLLPKVFKNEETAVDESFSENLLEYPQYTRPAVWKNKSAPKVLLSGNHVKIESWRKKKSNDLTKKIRPDLLKNKR